MQTGRPTKYTPDILTKCREYIDSCGEEVVEGKLWVKLPKAEGLALYLGVSRQTLYEWRDKHEEFSDILDEINQLQADRVIDGGVSGRYNPLLSKLLLGKHGYKEQVGLSGEGEGDPIKLDAAIQGTISKIYGEADSNSQG